MTTNELVKKDPKHNLLAMTSFMPVLQNTTADIAEALAAVHSLDPEDVKALEQAKHDLDRLSQMIRRLQAYGEECLAVIQEADS